LATDANEGSTNNRSGCGAGTPRPRLSVFHPLAALIRTTADPLRALSQYKGMDGSNPPPFIKEFIAMKAACARVKFAVETFNSLTQEKTVITCGPNPASSRRSKRRR